MTVIPAKAGIHALLHIALDPGFRRDDEERVRDDEERVRDGEESGRDDDCRLGLHQVQREE